MFIGALIIAYFLSRYITRSIEEVRKKLEVVQINEANEKLIWKKKDEIGVLVSAYNNMIDKLEISKKKLAQNERQSAWREMAKQIAHEIKNPLTPMKLSVQHLSRVLKVKNEEETQLKEFEGKMIQQIDLLSEIADEFSNFAELPKAKMKSLDICNIIEKTIGLYNHHNHISIVFKNKGVSLVNGDENQLTRVFNNLLKNSIQAIGKKGTIYIEVDTKNDITSVTINDDGEGVPDDIKDKIFEPKFTTKSSGKGLGLPMVAQIISNHNGNILLVQKETRGACFKISLPAQK